MKSGQMARPSSSSPGTRMSKKARPKKSSAELKSFVAKTEKDGTYYIICFEDGLVTQGKNRENALVMAADLRAINDDRHPSSYVARWISGERIAVIALPT